ncbi:MAG: hypothetical protein P4M13_10260 [Alphaproteobacteria bacterium]|nr:hypothetical protein [Alphaproteobacteria bacterium]
MKESIKKENVTFAHLVKEMGYESALEVLWKIEEAAEFDPAGLEPSNERFDRAYHAWLNKFPTPSV